jgi:hypothetical protein
MALTYDHTALNSDNGASFLPVDFSRTITSNVINNKEGTITNVSIVNNHLRDIWSIPRSGRRLKQATETRCKEAHATQPKGGVSSRFHPRTDVVLNGRTRD